jgi:hypothetical protein
MEWSALTSFSRYDTSLNYYQDNARHRNGGHSTDVLQKKSCTHVAFGTYPPDTIRVTFCLPPVPRPGRLHSSERMQPLDNRHPIVSCYEAFAKVLATSFHFFYGLHVVFFEDFCIHEHAS